MSSAGSDVSLQEQFLPMLTCFGCGPANPQGLRLRSFPAEDALTTVAEFTPWPEHGNGLGFVNGGIICTVLDCHSATPMLLEAARMQLFGDTATLPFVTAGLEVRYLRPTPMDVPLQLSAHVLDGNASELHVSVELACDGKVRASAIALWKPWRPRTT